MADFSPGFMLTLEEQAKRRGLSSAAEYVAWLNCWSQAVKEGLSGADADRRAGELLAEQQQ